jgi:hypothetical protein
VLYVPRIPFVPFHARNKRWAVLVCHRRCGKTVAAINDIVGRALNTRKTHAQYAYIAPFYSQAKRVAFDYLLRYTSAIRASVNIAELKVTLVNGAVIYLFGADNPDALRGIYLDGVVIDEPAQMRPRLYSEVIRPLLADRQGWATFIGTPNGKNEFYEIVRAARANPKDWFHMTLPASISGLIPQPELDDARSIMGEDEYLQEFECSFEAAIKGSYYGRLINEMTQDGRLGTVPYDPSLPVQVSMDLGYTDSTATWMWQNLGTETRYIEAYEFSGLAISDYVDLLSERTAKKGYVYGAIWLPPDARAKSLQTGRSLIEILISNHGIRPNIVPAMSVQQGIQASRLMLQSAYIDAIGCAPGVEALRQYQREWDDTISAFKQNPKHDRSSHFSDSFRYSALVSHRVATQHDRASPSSVHAANAHKYDPAQPFGGNVRLEDLYAQRASTYHSHAQQRI